MSTFQLHRNGPCVLCKGADQDSDFDYCRACGFTVLPLEKPADKHEPTALDILADTCRLLAHPGPPSAPVNLTALTNEALRQGKVTFFDLPTPPAVSGERGQA